MSLGLYRAATHLAEPVAGLALVVWARAEGGALRAERLGRAGGLPGAPWFHAASLGELRALAPVVRAWQARGGGPIQVTTTSATGRLRAAELSGESASLGPLDLPAAVRRSFDRRRPPALVLVETEVWPNLLTEAARRGVPVGVVNARLSDRSWPRYRRLRRILRPLVAGLRAVAARSSLDAGRWLELGARPEAVRVTGNTKVDGGSACAPVRLPWPDAPVWTAGSIHPGELDAVLDAFARVRRHVPRARLVLAPRHLENAADAREAAVDRGFSVAARSAGDVNPAADVLLLDTHGELAAWLAASTVAFIGGTLVPVGGHNPLEASAAGVPVVLGPYQANVRDEADRLAAAGAARSVTDGAGLAEAVRGWFEAGARGEASAAALRVVAELGGAGERAADWLAERGVLERPRG